MDSDSLLKELQGYTVQRLKELCSVRGIKFVGKAKEELISLLGEKMAKESTKVEFSDSLMKMHGLTDAGTAAPDAKRDENLDSTTTRETGEANASCDR